MTRIKIHRNNKKLLDAYTDGTYEEKLSKLLEEVEEKLPLVEIDNAPVSNMRISDELYDRIYSYKLTSGESMENIIIRMLLLSQSLNTNTE